MESDQYMKWDAFRSVPRIKREQISNDTYFYWLQWLKFLIFLFAHGSCLLAAFFSKAVVLIMATNIGMSTYSRSNVFYLSCSMPLSNQSFDRLSCLCASLWLIQIVPDLCAFLQDVWICKDFSKPRDRFLVWSIILLESCRAAGLSLLTMTVFPQLDVARCVLLSCAIIFVVQLQYAGRHLHNSIQLHRSFWWRLSEVVQVMPPTLLFSALFSGGYLWALFGGPQTNEFKYLLPVAFLLCGVGYWESWIDDGHASGPFREAYEVKYGMRKLNAETRMCSCVLRFLCASTVLYWSLRYHTIPLGTLVTVFWKYKFWEGPRRLFVLAFIAILANFYLRLCFRFLAAMRIKLLPLVHPALLTIPSLFLWSYGLCYYVPICRLNTLLHTFGLSFYCVKAVNPMDGFSDYYVTWIWLMTFVVWTYYFIKGVDVDPSDEITAEDGNRIFESSKCASRIETMTPMMCGLDICQSLMIFHWAVNKKTILNDLNEDEKPGDLRIVNGETDRVLTLYVCATMWHETRIEMIQMLRSILKLDTEHAMRLAEENSSERIKFRLEIHIFFDDAWVDDDECGRIPNSYFKLFFETLMKLTRLEDNSQESDSYVSMLASTSYGGRLVHQLDAGTLLFVHLKDKKLIRHKKRWSQVMYMYYLLGHRIMDSHLAVEDRQLQAENTYILAIDGDSKFEPSAVIRLLHLMNIKSDIGCACGRIHPIGEGIMVWYQKFEYAIAHWFQKAAEHVFGCVLCAPGCFSLFRASALMDDNVMHKYTKTASEPRHFVQYDQGEDRWLSTLLLKQGYRIEYAAAADADTYAPEGFEEFFNQRRRWTPSSIANTFDLLADYQLASKNNRSISKLYILYQMFVIGFSMLGPAIVFTMLVYAQVSAFAMDSTRVLMYNGIPISAFIITCFCFESSAQLTFAKIASIAYAFIMLAVLIATAQQVVLETIFSPTSAFVLSMFLIFFFSSFVHPKEFSNIIFGCVFFLMIPSTYVFLSLYSLINLNIINWGTREAAAKATGGVGAKQTIAARFYQRYLSLDDETSLLSRLLARRSGGEKKTGGMLVEATTQRLLALEQRVENQERNMADQTKHDRHANAWGTREANALRSFEAIDKINVVEKVKSDDKQIDRCMSTYDVVFRRSFWMDLEYLQRCGRGKLRLAEERFWDELIDKYLKPIESTPEEQAEIASGLATLRNRIAFTIILLNGLLVLAVFLLQRHKDVLSIQLTPYEGFKWTKLNEMTGKFEETTDALKVDPLGLGIIFFLMGILIVQTIGMIVHRLNTLIEALHELNEVEGQVFKEPHFKDYRRVLDEARQMIDTMSYEKAHGADGYARRGVGESKVENNVLYKLQTKDN